MERLIPMGGSPRRSIWDRTWQDKQLHSRFRFGTDQANGIPGLVDQIDLHQRRHLLLSNQNPSIKN